MRSTIHGPEVYLLKSKKPHIQDLVSSITKMSIEEIEKLNEKPDIKQGLLNIKKKQSQDAALSRAELLADMMIAKHNPEFTLQNYKN